MRAATTATANQPHNLRNPLLGPKRTWRQWLREVRIPLAIGSIVMMVVVVLSYLNATYVSGVELNCQTWQLRKFSFRRDPFTNRQLTAVYHTAPYASGPWTSTTGAKVSVLDPAIGGLLGNRPGAQARWDLVRLQASNVQRGQADILVELLNSYDRAYALYWIEWTADEPGLAKILWPAAQDLTLFERYADLPQLFRLARTELKAAEFKAAIGAFVQDSLLRYARTENVTPEQAQAAAKTAISYGPSESLDRLLKELGQPIELNSPTPGR